MKANFITTPAISVVMPVYNGEKYLTEAIDSILNQTFTDFEFIIINDGSSDKTEEIILSYSDERIIYVKNEVNLNIVHSLNKGIALAKGKYIARMDADDISLPKRFEKQFSFMESHLDIDVCGCFVQTFGVKVNEWKYPITPEEIKVALLFFSPLAHPTVFGKAEFFKNHPYDLAYQKAEDFNLWASQQFNARFANIPEVLLKYRLHVQQISKKDYDNQLQISNLIRKNRLKALNIDFNDDEFQIHVAIIHNQLANPFKAKMWLSRLLDQNKKKLLINPDVFKQFLSERFNQKKLFVRFIKNLFRMIVAKFLFNESFTS